MQHRAAASNGGSEKGASTEEDYIYVGVTGERDEGFGVFLLACSLCKKNTLVFEFLKNLIKLKIKIDKSF